jgi:hypothetical protein
MAERAERLANLGQEPEVSVRRIVPWLFSAGRWGAQGALPYERTRVDSAAHPEQPP